MSLREKLTALVLCAVSVPAMALDFGRIGENEIAVYAQELDSGKVVADYRSDVAVNPASTMKLITAFAAFQALGKDYHWTTELKSSGKIQGDTLEGDIYWVGSGDPVLDQDGLIAMQQQLRDKGIRKINGSLVLDKSVWGNAGSANDFGNDSGETFMTAPDPHMISYKTVWLKPERSETGKIVVQTNPPLPEIPLDNKVMLTASMAECPALKYHMRASYSDGVLHVGGKIPESCLGQEMFVNMLSTQELAVKSFINQWRKFGGEISDGIKFATAPKSMPVLASHQSKPLTAVLTDMNKHSNNLIARTVFLKLGEQGGGDTVRNAAAAVKRELLMAGIPTESLVLENGSGLSRQERVTARMMAQLLERAYFSPFQRDFVDTLPIAGVDGTLKSRLKSTQGKLHMKTGTLNNVRALAGYWLGDKPMVVVVIINSPKAMAYLGDLDKLVSRIVQPGGETWYEARLQCEKRLSA